MSENDRPTYEELEEANRVLRQQLRWAEERADRMTEMIDRLHDSVVGSVVRVIQDAERQLEQRNVRWQRRPRYWVWRKDGDNDE